ncbi:MAG: hypothetical protein K8R21_10615 [Leptospira sp.]|nr:hypothetical protein [Leptospira sp.]
MIQILIRLTTVEVAGKGEFQLEYLPIAAFRDHDSLLAYCDKKGFIKSGDGVNSIFRRDIDLSKIKDQVRRFFDLSQPVKVTEKHVIFEQELKGE